jgi:hypothetical protein
VQLIATSNEEDDDQMARVNQRPWRVPGQRAKRRAWGYTVQVDGKQKRVYRSEWTKDDAEQALAAYLMTAEPPKPTSGMTLAEAAKRYLATKARKRTLKKDERILKHLQSAFGGATALEDLTASRIGEYKASRLATKVGSPGADRLLTAAAVNRPLALLPIFCGRRTRSGKSWDGAEDQAGEGASGPASLAHRGRDQQAARGLQQVTEPRSQSRSRYGDQHRSPSQRAARPHVGPG